jgi:putative membrane protein
MKNSDEERTPDRAGPAAAGRPDYKDLLAGERTCLAWIRTALALAAGAVAVVQLLPPLPVPGLRVGVGLVLGVAGLSPGSWRVVAGRRCKRPCTPGAPSRRRAHPRS